MEEKFTEYPWLSIPFMLSTVLSVSLIFAFIMQWNDLSMAQKQINGYNNEKEKIGKIMAGLKWYFLGSFIAAKEIYLENKGSIFVFLAGIGFGGIAWGLYQVLEML